jgi:hypothetical protein
VASSVASAAAATAAAAAATAAAAAATKVGSVQGGQVFAATKAIAFWLLRQARHFCPDVVQPKSIVLLMVISHEQTGEIDDVLDF